MHSRQKRDCETVHVGRMKTEMKNMQVFVVIRFQGVNPLVGFRLRDECRGGIRLDGHCLMRTTISTWSEIVPIFGMKKIKSRQGRRRDKKKRGIFVFVFVVGERDRGQ